MTDTQPWTPGRWFVQTHDDEVSVWAQVEGDQYPVADMAAEAWAQGCWDARLIAAAPEMAELLELAHGTLAFRGMSLTQTERMVLDRSRDLLSRIRGETDA